MKKNILAITFAFLIVASPAFAGTGKGYVVDITVHRDLNVLLVKVSSPGTQPGCADWEHTYAAPFDEAETKGILALLLSAMATNQKVRLGGTGSCYTGTHAEEFDEANIGPWDQ